MFGRKQDRGLIFGLLRYLVGARVSGVAKGVGGGGGLSEGMI